MAAGGDDDQKQLNKNSPDSVVQNKATASGALGN